MSVRNKDYYKILQVDPSADPEVIEAAYKRLARKYHPDMNQSRDATLRMQEINAAYEALRNPEKRAQYDRQRSSYDTRYAEERRRREEAEAARQRAEQRAAEEQRKREEAEAAWRRAQEAQLRQEQATRQQHQSTSYTDTDTNSPTETLLYQSNFYTASDHWGEASDADHRAFRKNGYYHLAILKPNCYQDYSCLYVVSDFEVSVDVQCVGNSSTNPQQGLSFCLSASGNYSFMISHNGYYSLNAYVKYVAYVNVWTQLKYVNEWTPILDWRFSEAILQGNSVNALAVRKMGNTIELYANGILLSRVVDNQFPGGAVGVAVSTWYDEPYAEARFRDFRIISIGRESSGRDQGLWWRRRSSDTRDR